MGSRYSIEQIVHAKQLYLQGHTLQEIAKVLAHDTGRPTSKVLVWKWAKDGGWKEERMVIEECAMTQVSQQVAADRMREIVDMTLEYRDAYREVWQKGLKELQDLKARNASEATAMIDLGIKGETRIMEGVLPHLFVEEILAAVQEEVPDDETLDRISRRLKGLAVKYADQN